MNPSYGKDSGETTWEQREGTTRQADPGAPNPQEMPWLSSAPMLVHTTRHDNFLVSQRPGEEPVPVSISHMAPTPSRHIDSADLQIQNATKRGI